MPNLCLHCEQAPRQNYLRLCNQCAAQRGIRRLYEKTANWTPQRDARIQALVEKAKRREPPLRRGGGSENLLNSPPVPYSNLRNSRMNTHSLHQPPPSSDEEEIAPAGEEKATALSAHQATQLDVCRCPKCEAPMTARCGVKGPYFHCLCAPRPRLAEAITGQRKSTLTWPPPKVASR
jgi:hypothetical protein